MFDGIAGGYDDFNHTMSLGIDRGWRRKAIRFAVDPQRPCRILDVACGTGDFTIALARAAVPGSHVTGIDLSEGMLALLPPKAGKAGVADRIDAKCGDCAALPFGDASFDAVTVAFGVRNFEDRAVCLKEMRRVLRPGGSLVILELSVPRNPLVRAGYRLYLEHLMPLAGKRISGDISAYRYLASSVEHFPLPEAFLPELAACGFSRVRHRALSLGICRLYTACRED